MTISHWTVRLTVADLDAWAKQVAEVTDRFAAPGRSDRSARRVRLAVLGFPTSDEGHSTANATRPS